MNVLISVSDKTGIIQFAQKLHQLKIKIISTGGTAKALKEAGIPVTLVQDVTKFPEMMNGRVKTLHPKIHGAILAKRDNDEHMKALDEHQIDTIDMVVVNLYPFEATIQKSDVTLEEAIENIDIGGPSMIRSAAKNHQDVTVVVNPNHYEKIINELTENKSVSTELRYQLACEAFSHTALYDTAIANYLMKKDQKESFPEKKQLCLTKKSDLRYGENPHQKAAFYQLPSKNGVTNFTQHHGKELSYNNMIDFEAAYQLVREFSEPTAVVIKHTNPCGVAVAETIDQAYQNAYDCDPVSAFGSIVGLNRPVDEQTAEKIQTHFVEVIIAPSFTKEALNRLTKKPSLRLIELEMKKPEHEIGYRFVQGGLLVQQTDINPEDQTNEVVTTEKPNQESEKDLQLANIIVKHVKSNAIVIVKEGQLIGTGAGQMSRVKSVQIALEQAGEKANGAVMASDAFFPFKDSVELAAKAKIAAIIQPGGSKRDEESIQACNDNNIAMVMTKVRHFKH